MIRILSGATWIRLSAITSFTTTFFTIGNLLCLILSAARWRCSFSYNLHQMRYGKRGFVTDGRRVTLVLIIKKNSFLYFNVNFYSFCHPRASVSFTSDPDFSSRSSCCRLNNIKCCPNGTTTTAVLKKKNPRRTSGRWCHWTDPFDECVSLSLSHFSRGMIQMPIMKWKWFNKKLNEIEWGIWKNRSAIDPIVGFSPQCTQESLFPYPSFLKLSFICFSLLSFLFYSQRLRTWRWILKRAFGFSRAAN